MTEGKTVQGEVERFVGVARLSGKVANKSTHSVRQLRDNVPGTTCLDNGPVSLRLDTWMIYPLQEQLQFFTQNISA